MWSDDVESGDNGWTAVAGTQTGTTGGGWIAHVRDARVRAVLHRRVAQLHGFDDGLRYAYATRWTGADGARTVDFTPYNAPGMLLWYRDSTYSNNDVADHLSEPPSIGSKGTVLLVDAHSEPGPLLAAPPRRRTRA